MSTLEDRLNEAQSSREAQQILADNFREVSQRCADRGDEQGREYWQGEASKCQAKADDPDYVNPYA